MSVESMEVALGTSTTHRYPMSHWEVLSRFIVGQERDPKEQFCLVDDIWDVSVYAEPGKPVTPGQYRIYFRHLHSFLKPYVKWFLYQRLLGKGKALMFDRQKPYDFTFEDTYCVEHSLTSIDDLASTTAFSKFWQDHLPASTAEKEVLTRSDVRYQRATYPFWKAIRAQFGVPQYLPPMAPHVRRHHPTKLAADESKLIPLPVIRQLVNKLALHRTGKDVLTRYNHLRLCVLILAMGVGRRIDEVLGAPRGSGVDGPLSRYPAREGTPDGALWFQFTPNKDGPKDHVYISSEWEDVLQYVVHVLIGYSDEVRGYAAPDMQGLLILTSSRDLQMSGLVSKDDTSAQDRQSLQTDLQITSSMQQERGGLVLAGPLTYANFITWLNGERSKNSRDGIMTRWKITVDGSPDGAIYHLRTHQFRHMRQNALASDPRISLVVRQRDLNHTDPDMQLSYQHGLSQQHALLLEKAREGQFCGPGMAWIEQMLDIPSKDSARQPSFQPGRPALLDVRWRNLIRNEPHFVEINRVPCGYCALPQGPGCCAEFMNCTEAADEGCRWFLTDPNDEVQQLELAERAHQHRLNQQQSLAAGKVVQAGKYEVMAQRTEAVQAKALQQTSKELRMRLEARMHEMKEQQQ